ncbi:MAG: hypothetical protein ACFFB8_14295 [Promethearchaeota archaeon]
MAKRSKEWREKISRSIAQKWKDKEYRQKQMRTRHSEEYRTERSKEMQKKWDKDEFKQKMTGESHPNWNPNRDQVEKPYGPGWWGEKEDHVRVLKEEQCNRDALSGEKFKDNDTIVRHHIDYDKTNNDLENLCALTPETHGKVHNDSKMSKKEYMEFLILQSIQILWFLLKRVSLAIYFSFHYFFQQQCSFIQYFIREMI